MILTEILSFKLKKAKNLTKQYVFVVVIYKSLLSVIYSLTMNKTRALSTA